MRQVQNWQIHAVGGTVSMTEEGIRKLSEIRKRSEGPCVFVVSSIKEDPGSLTSMIDLAICEDQTIWAKLEQRFQHWMDTTEKLVSDASRVRLQKLIKDGFNDIENVLKAVRLVGDASESSRKYVESKELFWILTCLQHRFETLSYHTAYAESSELFIGRKESSGIACSYDETKKRLEALLSSNPDCDTICIAGGWMQDGSGRLIDRLSSNSEFIASACAHVLDAQSITFWNDDQLVTTADPAEVPGAEVISSITFAEATELSYFGSKVLHPQAFVPAMAKDIPIHLRTISDIDHPGTKVSSERADHELSPIRGFSVVHQTALINIEGAGMIGVPGISSRLFTALQQKDISVILISQASSEHSICFAVHQCSARLAAKTAERVFAEELAEYKIQSIEVENECAILAAVGEDMPGTAGLAAKFFGALGKAHVNVRAIAQGSSERNISAVISDGDATKALRALHAGFFLSRQTLSIGLIGPGLIGSTLLRQIAQEAERLRVDFNVDLRVRGIANSRRMLLDGQGIDLQDWESAFEQQGETADLDVFASHVAADYFPHAVLIDCSTSSVIPEKYHSWIERGIHLITPNKKAGTAVKADYDRLMHLGRKKNKHFLYETTVGAGLPVIGTLKDLIQTGDRIRKIEGVFSGTLAYLFWRFDGSTPFSQLVQEAKELGYTEPDPRDDLTGMDIVRKAVILAREVGMDVEVEEVPVLSLVPEGLIGVSPDEFMAQLSCIDEDLLEMQQKAAQRHELLKYVGIIDPINGECRVELKAYPSDHPFARITGTDNIVAFTTDRYHEQPLVIQGPGAGPEVTAGGVFADLLRLGSFLGARY